MQVLAPAKINLHLRVGPRRDDGFHPLVSWMCTIGLFDSLSFERSDLTVPREFALRCDKPDLPCGAENLVCRAAVAFGQVSSEPLGIDAVLRKSIPSGAGLGGGSSDAARALMGLNHFCKAGLSIEAHRFHHGRALRLWGFALAEPFCDNRRVLAVGDSAVREAVIPRPYLLRRG